MKFIITLHFGWMTYILASLDIEIYVLVVHLSVCLSDQSCTMCKCCHMYNSCQIFVKLISEVYMWIYHNVSAICLWQLWKSVPFISFKKRYATWKRLLYGKLHSKCSTMYNSCQNLPHYFLYLYTMYYVFVHKSSLTFIISTFSFQSNDSWLLEFWKIHNFTVSGSCG